MNALPSVQALLAEQRELQSILDEYEEAQRVKEQIASLRERLKSLGLEINPRHLRLDDIAKPIADAYGIKLSHLRGPSSAREYAWPRQHFCWQARQVYIENNVRRWSYPVIGRYLNRHHSTVIHGEEAHGRRLAAGQVVVEPDFRPIFRVPA